MTRGQFWRLFGFVLLLFTFTKSLALGFIGFVVMLVLSLIIALLFTALGAFSWLAYRQLATTLPRR